MGLARVWNHHIRELARLGLGVAPQLWPPERPQARGPHPRQARDPFGPPSEARLAALGNQSPEQVLAQLETGQAGLRELEAERRRRHYGPNEIPQQGTASWPMQLLASVRNPLVMLLTALAALSLVSGEA